MRFELIIKELIIKVQRSRLSIFTFSLFLSATLMLLSCEHKELCMDHSHITNLEVEFDWQHAPEAAPATMSLYMFPEGGGEGMRYEFTDYHGGTIRIPTGNYRAFCINSDTEVIRYRNTKEYGTFELITRNVEALMGMRDLMISSEAVPRAPGAEDERTAFSPDPLWSDRCDLVEVVAENGAQVSQLTLTPKSVVCTYTIEIHNVENLKYVNGLSGSLSGLTEGYLPGTDALGQDRVTIPFEVSYSPEEGIARGALRTFGHCYDTNVNHTLVIYAVMSDGGKYYYTFDVTEQMHSADDQRNIHIVIDKLPLPKPITNGGGFKPEIDDWSSVDIELEM